MLIGLIVALAVGVAVAAYLTRGLTRPILSCAAFADRVSGGDLKGELAVDQKDEVGRLAQGLRAMIVFREAMKLYFKKFADSMTVRIHWISARMFCPANTVSSVNMTGKQTQIPSGRRSTT